MEEGCVYSDDTQLSPVALPCAGKKRQANRLTSNIIGEEP